MSRKITILHSNDIHGDFLPAPDADGRLTGGVALLSGYISQVRRQQPEALFLLAGDMFRGSVIDREYRGASTIQIINQIRPDAVALGNHELDYGVAQLKFLSQCADFPLINANLYFKKKRQPLLEDHALLRCGQLKILVISVVTEEVMCYSANDDLLGAFIGTEDICGEIRRVCRLYADQEVDLTILLTHLGLEADVQLAASLRPPLPIDFIIGGHSHTLLPEPLVVNNIPIVQVGQGSAQLGRFDVNARPGQHPPDFTWQLIPVREGLCPPDQELARIVGGYQAQVEEKYRRELCRFQRELTHPARNQETELGDLFCDIFTSLLGVDAMLLASGSIRRERLGPVLRQEDLLMAFPYDEPIYMFAVSGQQFRGMIQQMFRSLSSGHNEFYQLPRGFQAVFSASRQQLLSLSFRGREITDDARLKLAMQNYHFSNVEQFLGISHQQMAAGETRLLAQSGYSLLLDYFTTHNQLDQQLEGRLTILS